MKHILLSTAGGDRATAYTMSNKLIPWSSGYLVTWIDNQRQNQWAIVDLAKSGVSQSGPLGSPCVDNHCGAALTVAQDSIHAITGGHHSPFQHYRMHRSKPGGWEHVATVNVKGTYPSLSADSQGGIHLAFRTLDTKWTLDHCRFEDNHWTTAQPLVTADKPGYIYWTNGLTIDAEDNLHLVFGNTRMKEDGALLYGASHIVSDDNGQTWRDETGHDLSPPAQASTIPLIIDENCSDRIQSLSDQQKHSQPGPGNVNYQQIILSNPVIDSNAAVHVVLHNGLTGTADLMSRSPMGDWTAAPLMAAATNGDPTSRIHVQSSLTPLPDGRLRAALMIEQTEECVWGAPGTSIVSVETGEDGTPQPAVQVTPTHPDCAYWLPAQPHYGAAVPERVPALLYTKGVNAGGFGNNNNLVETEVFLCQV